MSRNNSMSAFQGFSVYQPSLGATLQWLPAMGTQELDELITAFLPGPASIQDKRAHISMDFFEYARQTGQNFKFYPIPAASFSSTTNSPASTAMYDSGYNSSFNTSPVTSDLGSWTPSPAVLSADSSRTKSRPSAKQPTGDFSSHPGMRIMTKDGRDVTNSASRGSKSKEQRDHAHLMRIIKACDSCKRKKTRCDPSHKKRSAAAQAPTSQTESKPAKKSRKATEPPPLSLPLVHPGLLAASSSFDSTETEMPFSFEDSCDSLDELWNKFVHLEPEPFEFTHAPGLFAEDYDFFGDLHGRLSPSSGSSPASPSQAFPPFTLPVAHASRTSLAPSVLEGVELSTDGPSLPYLSPGLVHGTNYIDFNLYSPASDFLDEEPQPVRKKSISPVGQQGEMPIQASTVGTYASLSDPPDSTSGAHHQQLVRNSLLPRSRPVSSPTPEVDLRPQHSQLKPRSPIFERLPPGLQDGMQRPGVHIGALSVASTTQTQAVFRLPVSSGVPEGATSPTSGSGASSTYGARPGTVGLSTSVLHSTSKLESPLQPTVSETTRLPSMAITPVQRGRDHNVLPRQPVPQPSHIHFQSIKSINLASSLSPNRDRCISVPPRVNDQPSSVPQEDAPSLRSTVIPCVMARKSTVVTSHLSSLAITATPPTILPTWNKLAAMQPGQHPSEQIRSRPEECIPRQTAAQSTGNLTSEAFISMGSARTISSHSSELNTIYGWDARVLLTAWVVLGPLSRHLLRSKANPSVETRSLPLSIVPAAVILTLVSILILVILNVQLPHSVKVAERALAGLMIIPAVLGLTMSLKAIKSERGRLSPSSGPALEYDSPSYPATAKTERGRRFLPISFPRPTNALTCASRRLAHHVYNGQWRRSSAAQARVSRI
ncbi:hypothetical protein GQ53DRAFT_400163 [Thozetella sp. PMI_491]|nr:hypothetical protein GQ53DRAFT_400163 [Thozetella sp. PMI_491]